VNAGWQTLILGIVKGKRFQMRDGDIQMLTRMGVSGERTGESNKERANLG